MTMETSFGRGLRDSTPVILGLIPFALILGAEAQAKGLNALETALLMGVNFAGGSEFAAVGLWASPAPVLLIIFMTLMINSRYILMGATLVPHLKDEPLRRVLPALYVLTDETWALTISRAQQIGHFDFPYYFGTAAPLYLMWVSGGIIGSYCGVWLGDLRQYGFGMAFPAVFLVIIRGMWRGRKEEALPWLLSLVVATLVYRWQPGGGLYVIAGTGAGLALAYHQGGKKS